MTPRYRVLTKTFLHSDMFVLGDEIEYEGMPGPHLEPLNEEARVELEKYYESFPHMKTHASMQVHVAEEEAPRVKKVGTASKKSLEGTSVAEVRMSRPVPGPTDGGKVV